MKVKKIISPFKKREAYVLFPLFSFSNTFICSLIHWVFVAFYCIYMGYNRIVNVSIITIYRSNGVLLGTFEINLKFNTVSFTADASNLLTIWKS